MIVAFRSALLRALGRLLRAEVGFWAPKRALPSVRIRLVCDWNVRIICAAAHPRQSFEQARALGCGAG